MSDAGSEQIACPHCGNPLVVIEEHFRDWKIVQGDDVLLFEPAEPLVFDGGFCKVCRNYVNHVGGTDESL